MHNTIKMSLKKLLFIFLSFFLFSVSPVPVHAKEIQTNSDKYLLYNLSDNEILLEKNAHEQTYIASLTKIMTVITAIEQINDYNKTVEITGEMVDDIAWDVAIAGFKKGQILTYDDLLYGSILASGADAVNALAISISGSYDKFVELMNKKAKDLNLKNTNFANVTGLFDENNYSSAYDMSQILKYALNNKKFKEIFETHEYTTTNDIKLKSTLTRSSSYIGEIKGAKTGYINASGYCLATTATINDANLILITLNAYKGNTETPHIIDTINIYNYIKENYSYQDIISKKDIITKMKVKYTKEKEIDLHANQTIEKFLPNDFDKEAIDINFSTEKKLTYFTSKGYNLGEVKITYNNEEIGNFNLLYEEETTFSLTSFIFSNIIYIILIILFIKFLINFKKYQKKQRKKALRKKHS